MPQIKASFLEISAAVCGDRLGQRISFTKTPRRLHYRKVLLSQRRFYRRTDQWSNISTVSAKLEMLYKLFGFENGTHQYQARHRKVES